MEITILNIHERTGICIYRDTQTQIKIHTHAHTRACVLTNIIPSGHSVRGTTTRGIRQSIGENKQTPAAYNDQSQLVDRA